MNKKFNYNFATKEIVGSKAAIEKANKMNLSELARICNLSRTTVYK